MKKKFVTKELFLNTYACPTYGWHLEHSDSTEPVSLPDQLRMEEGLQVHQRARKLFPEGVLIVGDNITAYELTQRMLKNKKCSVILEATFIVDGYITKTDILIREPKGWKVIEVKSSTQQKPEHIDDMAYTVMVAKKAGLQITSVALWTISKDYRLGMPDDKLFEEHDCTDAVFEQVEEFEQYWDEISAVLQGKEAPYPQRDWICKNCEYYHDCFRETISNTIYELPYLGGVGFSDLQEMGVFYIKDIPNDYSLSDFQSRVKQAVQTEQPVIDVQGIKQQLDSIIFPAYYLDFETLMTCLPLYKDLAPYTQIATQYSVHVCSQVDELVEHKEYLADPVRDCRRELAERLVADCGTKGSVIVYYASFEIGRIKSMIEWFPDLKASLQGIIDRIVDLHDIVRNYYYHPQFHGSTSIKVTLPVMVPEMSYEGMSIADGSSAMAVFAYMVKGKYVDDEIVQLRRDLLQYCSLDTLAMVKLHEKLEELVQ
ncbi:MAG: DUF2779 domain-containing protein [Tissierellales bacterium]|nr:DUF2779 domain-containing protein [Tissierellales bacterium]